MIECEAWMHCIAVGVGMHARVDSMKSIGKQAASTQRQILVQMLPHSLRR